MPELPSSTSRQLLAALAVVALAVAGFIGWRLVAQPAGGGPPIEVLAEGDPISGDGAADAEQPQAPDPTITVHVAGPVVRPGVVVLPEGARVVDAVAACGGLRESGSAKGLNLARVLADGELLDVGAPLEVDRGPAAAEVASGVDLNTATVSDLQELPGVGPVLAERIVAYRDLHGTFEHVEQLQEVSGIGPTRYAELRELVRVGAG